MFIWSSMRGCGGWVKADARPGREIDVPSRQRIGQDARERSGTWLPGAMLGLRSIAVDRSSGDVSASGTQRGQSPNTVRKACRSRRRRMSLWRRPIREIRPARLHGSSGRGSVFQKPCRVRRRGGPGAENADILKEIRLQGSFGGDMAGIAESRLAGAARILRGKSARAICCAASVRRSARSPVPRIPPAAICEGGG